MTDLPASELVWDAWWKLPGPRRYVHRVVEALHTGRNVVVLVPQRPPIGLYNAVRSALMATGLEVALRRIEVPPESAQRPADWLHRALLGEPSREAIVTARYLAQCPELDCLRCWLGVGGGEWQPWRSFIESFAEATRAGAESRRSAFVFVVCGEDALDPPRSGPTIALCDWRGYVGRLDMRLFVHELWAHRSHHAWHDDVWESVVTELAGADPWLAVQLSQLSIGELTAADQTLARLGREADGAGGCDGPTASPEELWARGLSDTLDGLPFEHSLVLARRDPAQLKRRIWKGQIRELMPRLEECRVEILPYFRRRFPKEADQMIEYEFSDLLDMQDDLGSRGDGAVTRRLLTLRGVRNMLAHFDVVPESLVSHRHLRLGL